jgi:hypothetical protein
MIACTEALKSVAIFDVAGVATLCHLKKVQMM